jgi:hypothetical protein
MALAITPKLELLPRSEATGIFSSHGTVEVKATVKNDTDKPIYYLEFASPMGNSPILASFSVLGPDGPLPMVSLHHFAKFKPEDYKLIAPGATAEHITKFKGVFPNKSKGATYKIFPFSSDFIAFLDATGDKFERIPWQGSVEVTF